MKYRKRGQAGGFTLIEMMVTMCIGMVILAALTTTVTTQTRFYNAQEQVNEMEQNGRGAMDIISRELKMAGYRPNTSLTLTGVNNSTSLLQVQADLNGSGTLTAGGDSHESIIYTYDSANQRIRRTTTVNGVASIETLADNITGFTFTYYDANDDVTNVASNIRRVKIAITARTAKPDPNYTSNSGYRTYQVVATITPPNLAL